MANAPGPLEWPTQIETDAPTVVVERVAPRGAPAPAPDDPRRRAFEDAWPWLLALGVLALAGVAALWWFGSHRHHPARRATPATQPTAPATTAPAPKAKATIAAPTLVGLTQAEAEAKLSRLGITPQVRPVKSGAATGRVVAQKPPPGAKIERGSIVVLDVSRGKPAAAVPDVTGRPAPEAVATLRKAGFAVSVVGVPSSEPKGTVVAESPQPGTKEPAGTTVRVNISKGAPQPRSATTAQPKIATTTSSPAATQQHTTTALVEPNPIPPQPASGPVAVPTVAGEAQTAAIGALEQAGLHSQVTLVQSQEPAGTVIAAQPAGGERASRGSVVQLKVSLGPGAGQTTTVPDVTGQDETAATQALEDAGFTVETVDRKVKSAAQDGKVVDEQPGGEAPQGWAITLVIARAA